MSFYEFDQRVTRLVRDEEALLAESDREDAIATAVTRYSEDRPREIVEDVTATAGGNLVDLPAGWENDFSQLKAIEYPIGEHPPAALAGFDLYRSPTGQQVRVADALPAGAQLRMTYTAAHQVDQSTDTVPTKHQAPVAAYAAAMLAFQLAAIYSGEQQSTIQADSIDHADKARRFNALGGTLRKRYFDSLGINPKRSVAAGAVVDLDLPNSQGRDRFHHSGRYR